MNPFANIFKHPRTSAAGVLISVATVAGVLAQQGVTIGHVGGGNVISLAAALATALLGLLARDPDTPATDPAPVVNCPGNCSNASAKSSTTAKLSAWMLIALLLPLPWMQGCTTSTVAKDIVSWTPSLESAVAAVNSTAAVLAPADAAVFARATAGISAASNVLVAQAQAYLANPTANMLAQLQNQIVTLQQQVNSALLNTARIVDSASQQHALAAIQAVAAIATAILALVQSVSNKADVARMATDSTIKLATVAPYINAEQSARLVADHYGETIPAARLQINHFEQDATNAGF